MTIRRTLFINNSRSVSNNHNMDKYNLGWILCLHLIFVNGWQCPDDKVIQEKYVRSGEPAVISFQTTLINAPNQLLSYSVTNFNVEFLYSATFFNNQYQNGKPFLGSEFIGDARTGNFTLKTAAVNSTNGGMYLLQYKVGSANYSTEKCLMLYVLGIPQKATITQVSNNILGRDSKWTCNSLSTTYPTNHTLNLVYNWKVNDVTNPTDIAKYVYSTTRNQLTIKSISKEDANTILRCSATETGGSITGLPSDESNQLTFQVIYGPDADTTGLNPPNTQYNLTEGVALADITCSGECYPSCNYKWIESGTTLNNRAVLSLGELSKTEAGVYTCEVTNSNTTSITAVMKKVTVNVIFGPDASSTSLTPSTTSYTINEGSPLNTIHCSGDCYPACNYKWTKAGNGGFTPVNNANLSLGSLHRDKAGTYICTVSNPTTTQEQTKTVSISVIFGPDASTTSLTPATTSYSQNEGSSLNTIRCSGDCFPACNYKWTKTGNSKTPVNNGNLSLGSLHRDEAGTYICTVSNPTTRQEQTKTVFIFVIYGPDADSLKLNPSQSSYTENEGTSLNDITCSTDCYPICTYKWTKSGSQFIESNVLSLGTLNKNKAATYTCTAYNPTTKHSISTSVIVHVRFGPTVCRLNVPSRYNLTEGKSSSEMTCQAECYPECTYSWTNVSSNSPVGTNGKLQLINSKRYEAGTYKCLCENKPLVKRQSSSVVITIQYPPDVTVLQSTTNITEGNNLTLTCDAKGVPSVYQYNNLTQTWNGVLIPNTNSEKFGTPKYSSLYIPSLQLQDSGTYSCFVNNGVNTTDSTSSVEIKVKGLPKVLTGLLTFIGKTGKETNVRIQFYSFPEIQDVIFKNSDDQTMKNDTAKKHIVSYYKTVVKEKLYGKEVSLICMQANLLFKEMIPDDFGGYTLILKNEIGEISTHFEIKAESEPSIPTGFTYENIDGIHSLSWVSGFNGGNRQTFIIQMSVSDQDSWQNRTSITEELGVKNFIIYSVNMSDLTPGTYKARIYAWNKNGYSDYVILNETITITEQKPGEEPFPVGIVAGVVSSVVALGIAAAIGFFVLRRLRTKDESRSKLNSRSGTGDEDSDDEDEVNTVNPMYVSADEVKSGTSANNEKKKDDVYAMVDKKPKKANVGLDNLYAMPEKKDKKNQKKGDVKNRKKDKPKKETGGDVYENAPVNAIGTGKKTAYEENPYENPEISDTRKAPLRNKDGLIYADLAFNDQPKGQKKLVIHGLDDMTEYVEVDFTKKADPLPDSDEENK